MTRSEADMLMREAEQARVAYWRLRDGGAARDQVEAAHAAAMLASVTGELATLAAAGDAQAAELLARHAGIPIHVDRPGCVTRAKLEPRGR